MTSPISNIVNTRPSIAWLVSRLPSLDPWSRTGGGAAGRAGEAPRRAPVASPGVAQGLAADLSQVDPTSNTGLRDWIEDRLLLELSERLMPFAEQAPPAEHIDAVRTAILQLHGSVPHAEALRVLKDAAESHAALQQGRCALQGV